MDARQKLSVGKRSGGWVLILLKRVLIGGQGFGARVHPERRATVSHQAGFGRRPELSKLHITRYFVWFYLLAIQIIRASQYRFVRRRRRPALGQVMLYVDGMNGVIEDNPTIQWLYSLLTSRFRLVVKTALKLLLVFIEYVESNCLIFIQAVHAVHQSNGKQSALRTTCNRPFFRLLTAHVLFFVIFHRHSVME